MASEALFSGRPATYASVFVKDITISLILA